MSAAGQHRSAALVETVRRAALLVLEALAAVLTVPAAVDVGLVSLGLLVALSLVAGLALPYVSSGSSRSGSPYGALVVFRALVVLLGLGSFGDQADTLAGCAVVLAVLAACVGRDAPLVRRVRARRPDRPLTPPQLDELLAALPTDVLVSEWARTSAELRQRPAAQDLAAVVRLRAGLLDELERRHAEVAVTDWTWPSRAPHGPASA